MRHSRSLYALATAILLVLSLAPAASSDEAAPAGRVVTSTFVVTGTLPSLSRARAEALVREMGGIATASVTRNTTYLVVGENPGSKLAAAQRLGTAILNEQELLELVDSRAMGAGS